MKYIDLEKQQIQIRDEIDEAIKSVLDHQLFIMGPEVNELEEILSKFVGVKHCISASSGTDALLIALMSLGIGAGDEVITTPFTFVSTAEVIVLLGAKPVYVDIDPDTYNIDATKIEKAITTRTKLILPVSLYGQCSDMIQINEIALKYDLPVVEDAAQSFGATFNGSKSCSLSTFGCTSFFPSKPLGCYGDGGALFTNNDKLAQVAREIRSHGQEKRYFSTRIGVNGRIDTIQAAVLLVKMKIFEKEVALRKKVGDRYTKLFNEQCPDDIITPYIHPKNTSVYGQYTIQVYKKRDYLMENLKKYDIPTSVHYPYGINKQPAFATEEFNLTITDRISKNVVSIPMHPYLKEQQQYEVVAKCAKILKERG
jgi:UDP-2-acetamido-2-deoxy-ribo-hexuluronate aminotransferase